MSRPSEWKSSKSRDSLCGGVIEIPGGMDFALWMLPQPWDGIMGLGYLNWIYYA